MTTSANPSTQNLPFVTLLPLLERSLEALWLVAVFLVPLTFLGQEYSVSEAQIAYVEIPKVALLRLLAGLMALIWATEWAIKSTAFQNSDTSNPFETLKALLAPSKSFTRLAVWLKFHPIRWFLLSTWLFFGSTLVSTLLSASPSNSIWGEIPGQDGYSAYTIGSYGILFAVIATHLKRPEQVVRGLGAVITMGFLVGLYLGLQHYSNDILNVTESSGGGTTRVTGFMGNAIFAGAVVSMTLPATLLAAALHCRDENWGNWGPLRNLSELARNTIFTYLWAVIVSVQLLGLMFTFSRGPWVGAILSIVVFLGLLIPSFGWRMLIRVGLIIGLAGIFSLAFLHQQGSVSVVNVGPWLGFILATFGLIGSFTVLFLIAKSGKTMVVIAVLGLVAAVAGAVIFAPAALSGRGDGEAAIQSNQTGTQIADRVSSIRTDVLGGFAGGRSTHWKVSWELINDRPWFSFEDLSLSWIRPLVGYGPDLFRYTYLLKSPPDDFNFLPLEPDHAHNYFIHQTVEQGILGGISSLALFLSAIGIVVNQLLHRGLSNNPMYRLLLLGLVAIIIGRFLEMMVGVARISDLTVLWVIFGLLASLVNIDTSDQKLATEIPIQPKNRQNRRDSRLARNQAARSTFNAALLIRLAFIALLAGSIGVVSWQKSVNSVRASVAEGEALTFFKAGNLGESSKKLDEAIRLAPGVPTYYGNLASLYLAYQLRPSIITEPECDQQTETPYLTCLGLKSLRLHIESVRQQPLNYRSRVAAGNSSFNLQLNDSSLGYFRDAASMVPNSWSIKNEYSDALIKMGLYEDAIREADSSLDITGNSTDSGRALLLKGRALIELNQLDDALVVLKQSEGSGIGPEHLIEIQRILDSNGVQYNIGYFDALIDQDINDIVSTYFRGRAHVYLGNLNSAILDLQRSFDFGLNFDSVKAELGYAFMKLGSVPEARAHLNQALRDSPNNALINAYNGELDLVEGNFSIALNHVEMANVLNPELALAYLIRAKAYLSLGLIDSAKSVFESSGRLNFYNPQNYIDRGEIFISLGEEEMALADLDQAIGLLPNFHSAYNARAKAYALLGNIDLAIDDFDTAISIDSSIDEYFINRGVVYQIMGESSLASMDFETAISLGAVSVPENNNQNISYFSTKFDAGTTLVEADLISNLIDKQQWLRDLYTYEDLPRHDPEYRLGLQIRGEAYFNLGIWPKAIEVLTLLLQSSPNIPQAFMLRGHAYLKLNKTDEALKDFQQTVSFDPLNSESYIARGLGYAAENKVESARNDYNEALRLNEKSSDAFKLRGYLSFQTDDLENAFKDLDSAIELSPINHDAYIKRAEALMAAGEYDLALIDLNKAINLSSTNYEYFVARGLFFLESDQEENAFNDFNSAVRLQTDLNTTDPKLARSYILRGKTSLNQGGAESALEDANSAIGILQAFKYPKTTRVLPIWENRHDEIIEIKAEGHELAAASYAALGEEDEAQAAYQLADQTRSGN